MSSWNSVLLRGFPMSRLLAAFPFVSLRHSLIILRVSLAIFFMAHAAVRIGNDTIPQFASFLSTRGWPFALAIVWMISVWEISAGIALMLNRYVRLAAAGLMFIDIMGILIIHVHLGWFVGEHGTGGMEYSLALLVGLITICAADRESARLARR
jgi:putative oxidoreductase